MPEPLAIAQIEIPQMPGVNYLSRLETNSLNKALKLALPDLRKATRMDASAEPAHLKPDYIGHHQKTTAKPYDKNGLSLANQIWTLLSDSDAMAVTIRFQDQHNRAGYLIAYRREIL